MATPPVFTAGQVLTAAQMNKIGLWLITSQTIGSAVSSVPVVDAFSADFDNYRVIISGGAGSTGSDLRLNYGANTAGYYWAVTGNVWTQASTLAGGNNVAFAVVGNGQSDGLNATFDVLQPFTTAKTTTVGGYTVLSTGAGTGRQVCSGSFHNSATSFTDFTITPSAGTLTGGTINVYGYRN